MAASPSPPEPEVRAHVLPRFDVAASARVEPLGHGLINETFAVTEPGPGRRLVLQRVNPIFPAAIHQNIRAVTARLQEAGLATPRLVPTRDGAPCLELPPSPSSAIGLANAAAARPGPVWRLMTFVDGVSFDVVGSPAQAHAAGGLIARFHRALEGLDHQFVGMRTGVHDTARHLQTLAHAATAGARHGHRLSAEVASLAAEIAGRAAALPPLPSTEPRIGHGDLKFNNVLFAGASGEDRERAVCLIDLDTVGPQPLAFELGDAWRSWCNTRGEDESEAHLDLAIFEASLDGYLTAFGVALPEAERRALLLGPEWVSLELAARFAADAVNEVYFGWDSARFAGRGEHNLVRARGQLSLHRAFVETRPKRAPLLALSP